MRYRFLASLFLLIPLTAGAVYFPDGIDWTNPSQSRFVQSLYLNMLGRAPESSETQNAVHTLRANDNRTARLRMFESVLQSSEYRRNFNDTDNSWRVYQAPDYNYRQSAGNTEGNADGYYRYQAASSRPQGFSNIPDGSRSFTQSIARSVARYYNAYCYRGDPCIDNPELARERDTNLSAQSNTASLNNAHACADTANLSSQFKWVAINGTTYPRGIGPETICLEDSYFEANQLNLERYDCEAGYTNCKRNRRLDLRASRSGQDNDGHPSFFFRDGTRLALIQTDQLTTDNSRDNTATIQAPTDPLLANDAHTCTDPAQTTSRFSWQTATRSAESKGIGSNTICMDNYYYTVQRMNLIRHNCDRGFVNCRPDPDNNLIANSRKRVDGNPALVFPNGTTLILTARNLPPETTTRRSTGTNQSRPRTNTRTDTQVQSRTQPRVQPRTQSGTQPRSSNNSQQQAYNGSDCADSRNRISQFRWKSQGLSSWPDGIDGSIICLNNSYYEVTPSSMRNYTCQSNYTNCSANPAKNLTIRQVSQDGTVWTLGNGDELTLISK